MPTTPSKEPPVPMTPPRPAPSGEAGGPQADRPEGAGERRFPATASSHHPKARPVPAHPLFQPISDELVWDGRFPVQRVRFRYQRRDGRPSGVLTWELWRRGRAAVMLPWDPDTDRIVLIEQFRLPALAAGYEPLCLECPAGLLEPDEDPAGAAARELAEETGLVADRAEKLTEFMLTQGGADEAAWLYLTRVRLDAEGEIGLHGLETENEEIRVLCFPAAEAFAMAASGRINNAPALVALLWLQANHARLRQEWKRA